MPIIGFIHKRCGGILSWRTRVREVLPCFFGIRFGAALLLFGCLSLGTSSAQAAPLNLAEIVKNGGVRVEDGSGRVLLRYRDEDSFIPASTLKVATAFCTLEELGAEYRYTTSMALTREGDLYIKGSGDPSLVSEEFVQLAQEISRITESVRDIRIDTSLFEDDIVIDGASNSTNPYDARNAAFVGNYSSVDLQRSKGGEVSSAEPQTPLTPIALQVGRRLKPGARERINLGSDWRLGALYGGELLAATLRSIGVSVRGGVELARWREGLKPTFTYRSSKPLSEIVQGMLRFSNNFTANQLFLTLGMQRFGAPATVAKGQQAMTECLRRRVGWDDFSIEEGSGLSRKNRVKASLMTQLLQRFEPYRDLLKVEQGFTAKTGTLTGVNSLVGYFSLPTAGDVRFAVIINSNVPPMYKFTAANAIRQFLMERD